MYKNYFLFEKQVKEIKPIILGKTIRNIFSYQKNEVLFELVDTSHSFLQINISPHMPYILLQQSFTIRQPKFHLFHELEKQSILNIQITPFDKQITLEFETHRAIIIFYGAQPNVFILDSGDTVVGLFKKGDFKYENRLESGNDFRDPEADLTGFNSAESFDSYLKSKFSALNHTIIDEIIFRYEQTNPKNILDNNLLIKILQNISREMNNSGAYLYRFQKVLKTISTFRLYHLETIPDYQFQDFETVNEAWLRFVSEKNERTEFDKLYKMCDTAIRKRMDFLARSLKKAEQIKDLNERKRLAELKGNLLLTFKNQIEFASKEVILEDIFSDSLKKIRIKLNPNKSVIENAQIYFNKYKNVDKKRWSESVKSNTLQNDLVKLQEINHKFEQIKNLSSLKKIYQQLIDMNLLSSGSTSETAHMVKRINFKHLILEPDWQVYIGKSSDNNDALTFQFAHKQDYWFHAQGVPGSHVILKIKHKDQAPPYYILEQAAGIAAANSKAQHSATVPVIYTQVRYVSRIRNAPKGTVNTRNEKTLFVEPLQVG